MYLDSDRTKVVLSLGSSFDKYWNNWYIDLCNLSKSKSNIDVVIYNTYKGQVFNPHILLDRQRSLMYCTRLII